MKADVYKTSKDGSYLLFPRGHSASFLEKSILDDTGPLSFVKSIEIQPKMLGLNTTDIENDFNKQGYSKVEVKPSTIEQLAIKSEALNDAIKIALAPQWFALLLALIYVAGFLCVYTFEDRFGIHESGEEFLKSKYIQAGILFLLFPISILLPMVLKFSLRHTVKKEKHTGFKFPLSTMFSFINISFVFYFLIFTPKIFFFSKMPLIGIIIIATFLGPLVGDYLVEKIINERFQWLKELFRWFFVAFVLFFDVLIFRGFWKKLLLIIWGHQIFRPTGAIWYFVFMIMIPYALWRNNKHAKKLPPGRSRIEVRLLGASLCFMFLFLGIISFALHAYPYIPTSRGGGNFCESALVTLTFNRSAYSISNDPSFQGLTGINKFVIVEQSPYAFYLANVTNAGGPANWVNMLDVPQIIEVRRDLIDRIDYTPVTDTNYLWY